MECTTGRCLLDGMARELDADTVGLIIDSGHRREISPSGRTRTCNSRVLSAMPLHWATEGILKWSAGKSKVKRNPTPFLRPG